MAIVTAVILGAAGAAAGAGASFLGSKKKTKIPNWSPMDIAAEQRNALASNTANLPVAEELTAKTNLFNTEQIAQMIRRTIPGYDEKIAQTGKLIDAGLRGEVPEDVQKQLQSRNAARAVAGGYAGSGLHRAAEARDFGLTSWDITNKSMNTFQSWTQTMASLFSPGLTSVTSSFISPTAWMAQTQSDKENAWKVKTGQAIEESAPSRWESAAASGLGSLSSFAGLYSGMAAQNAAGATKKPPWSGRYGETAGPGAFNF